MRAYFEALLLLKPWGSVLPVHSGVWVTDLPQIHGTLCFSVAGQRPVWLSKCYKEVVLPQQVIPFFYFMSSPLQMAGGLDQLTVVNLQKSD